MKDELKMDDELLDKVSGGALYADVYTNIDSYISIYKGDNRKPEDLKNAFRNCWAEKGWQWSTNGSQEDLQAILDYIDSKWPPEIKFPGLGK